jgi:hypothetical protein
MWYGITGFYFYLAFVDRGFKLPASPDNSSNPKYFFSFCNKKQVKAKKRITGLERALSN